MKRLTIRLAILGCGAALAMLSAAPPRAAEPAPAAAPGPDSAAAELLRAWTAGEPLPDGLPGEDALVAQARAWMDAMAVAEPEAREAALRDVYRRSDSPYVRAITLRSIATDPDFRGRQAQFIRRYGFYSNWFNRLVFSASRLLQGNLQATAQLFIDAVNDLWRPPEADALERREFELALASGTPDGETPRIERLRRRVDRALAGEDLTRARWAFDQGDPEAALLYAGHALQRRPAWGEAEALAREAAAAAAEARRRALASGQVGYPDRTPPLRLDDPELVRSILLGEPAAAPPLVAALADAAASPTGRVRLIREWEAALAGGAEGPADLRQWAGAVVGDPAQNPDRALAVAQGRRRGALWRYIFLGPDSPRRQAYKTATWATQAWQALQNVGFFYLFEALGRGVQSAVAPSVPADAVLDAQARWFKEAPDPQDAEAAEVARSQARELARQGRHAGARAVLAAAGALDPARARKLDRAEAGRLARQAEAQPAGPARDRLLAEARALDPRVKVKLPKAPRPDRADAWRADWPTLGRWAGAPLPAGLPGEAGWFDGDPANGEVATGGASFEPRPEGAWRVRYLVTLAGERRAFEAPLALEALAPPLRERIELGLGLRDEARRSLEQLDRLPIPFEFEGGVGAGGVDLYPQLLPIETQPGEMELYR